MNASKNTVPVAANVRAGAHLDHAERRVLLDLIAAHPLHSCPQIAVLFAIRTGRRLSKVAVRRAWVLGYKSHSPAVSKSPGDAADEWPGWTDEVSVDVPWDDDDCFSLGPAAVPIGGAR